MDEHGNLDTRDLAGATILGAGTFEEYGSQWPTITVRTRRGRFVRLVVARDEEGNGPGALAFEEITAAEAIKSETVTKVPPLLGGLQG